MSDFSVDPATLERFAASSMDREHAFHDLRTRMDNAHLPRDSFGYIPGIGNRIHDAYDEFTHGCADAIASAAESMASIAAAVRGVVTAYTTSDQAAADRHTSVESDLRDVNVEGPPMSGDRYANQLEQWFSSLPQLVQETLHAPFTWMNDTLKQVAGHPEALLAAGQQYVQFADAIHQLGQQQLQHRMALAGHWRGDAYDAFTDKMHQVEAQLDKLAEATGQVKDLLNSGAQACVDGANMIVDIVTSLIMLALGTIAVNLALSLVTLGTSLAAGVAEVLAEAAAAAARIARVVEKVAQVLMKLAEVFAKLQRLLERITEALRSIKEVLKDAEVLAKTSKGWDKVGAKVSFGIQKAVVSKGIAVTTGGAINIPGSLGGFYHAGREYIDGWQDATDAQGEAPE